MSQLRAVNDVGKLRSYRIVPAQALLLDPGDAALVVQRHLGSDSLAAWIAQQVDEAGEPWCTVEKVRSAKGYRVLLLTRAG